MTTNFFATKETKQIQMQRCTDSDWQNLYAANSEYSEVVSSHRYLNQFYCPKPDAEMLKLVNRFDYTYQNSVVNVYVSSCTTSTNPSCKADSLRRTFFDGK